MSLQWSEYSYFSAFILYILSTNSNNLNMIFLTILYNIRCKIKDWEQSKANILAIMKFTLLMILVLVSYNYIIWRNKYNRISKLSKKVKMCLLGLASLLIWLSFLSLRKENNSNLGRLLVVYFISCREVGFLGLYLLIL